MSWKEQRGRAEFFYKACALHEAFGCEKLASELAKSLDVGIEERLILVSCALGSSPACSKLRDRAWSSCGELSENAQIVAGWACEMGDENSCWPAITTAERRRDFAAASRYATFGLKQSADCLICKIRLANDGKPNDLIDELTKACADVGGNNCLWLGWVQQAHGQIEEANKSAAKGCLTSKIEACKEASKAITTPLISRAMSEVACDAGHPAACLELADFIEKLGKMDVASELRKKACLQSAAQSCNNVIKEEENLVPPESKCLNYPEALLTESLDIDMALRPLLSASQDAITLIKFKPIDQTEQRKVVSENECNQETTVGCLELGKSDLSAGNVVEARTHFRRACKKNIWRACMELANLEEDLGNAPESRIAKDRAHELLKAECNQGTNSSCISLRLHFGRPTLFERLKAVLPDEILN